MKNQLAYLTQTLRRVFSLAVLRRDVVKSRIKFVQLQLDDEFTLDDIEHLEHFGFTSRALAGADAVVLCKGGNRGKTVCIMTADRKYRIEIAPGETAIYNRHGDNVHLRDDRTIECVTPAKVLMSTPLVECQQDVVIHGNLQVDGDSNTDGNHAVGGDNTVSGEVTAAAATINGRSFMSHTHNHDGDTTSGVN